MQRVEGGDVLTGPEVLRKEWDIKKTALQNLEKLGLARRPLALRQNGGTEKQFDADSTHHQEGAQLEQASDDDDAYAVESDNDNENPVATASSSQQRGQPQAGPSSTTKPPMDKKSKDIPKGFARIIRDDQGNVVDVVMSAYDEDVEPQPEKEEQPVEPETARDDEETPWGKPLVSRDLETRLQKAAQPVHAKSAALRRKLPLIIAKCSGLILYNHLMSNSFISYRT